MDPATYRHSHPHAYKLGQKANKKDNVERFLMGRQMFVVEQVASELTATPAAGHRPRDHHPSPWLPHLQLRLPQGCRSVTQYVEPPKTLLQTN